MKCQKLNLHCLLYFRALLQSMAAPLVFRRQTVRRINQEAIDR